MLLAVTVLTALGFAAVASASPPLPAPIGGFTPHGVSPNTGGSSLVTGTTPRSSLTITIAFKGGFSTPASFPDRTESSINDQITNVLNPWLLDVSRGRFVGYKRGSTHQYVQIQPHLQVCSNEWLNEVTSLADAAERLTGTDPDNYDAVVYYWKTLPCGFAGRADLPENGHRIILNGIATLQVVAHEFGHHLGLGHAGIERCTDDFGVFVPLFGPLESHCSLQSEYDNPYNAMGARDSNPIRSFSSDQLATLGWNPGAITSISAGAPAQTRILSRLEDHVVGGTEALRLVDGFADPVIWVEFRTPIHGLNNTGVLVVSAAERSLAVPVAQRPSPFEIDMTPSDFDHVEDVGLPVGQSWTDPEGLSPFGKLRITLNSADTHTASVTVQTIPSASDPAPVVPNVIGRSIDSAIAKIQTAGLVVGPIGTQIDCEDIGNVVSQSPAAGTHLPLGGTVTIKQGIPLPRGCGIPR